MNLQNDFQDIKNNEQDPKPTRIKGSFFILSLLVVFLLIGYAIGLNTQKRTPYPSQFKIDSSEIKNIPNFDSQLYSEVYGIIKDLHVQTEKINDQELFYGAVKGMVAAVGDPYTVFFDPDTNKEFNLELRGQFEGIGAEIGLRDEKLTVIAPLANSPAEHAGLRTEDIIVAIDSVDTFGMSLDEAVSLMRGDAGTKVTLTIFRQGNGNITEDIIITRSVIVIPSVKMIVEDKIAYIELYNFNSESERQLITKIISLYDKDIDGIILDVRNNPGGFLDKAVNIASIWLAQDTLVVREVFRNPQLNQEYRSVRQTSAPSVPLIILVNKGSASASEILAGALQDHEVATIVGSNTFGKGSVQDLQELSDGSGLKITISQWITPNGNIINDVGIKPNVEVEMSLEDYLEGRDLQLDKAKSIIKSSL